MQGGSEVRIGMEERSQEQETLDVIGWEKRVGGKAEVQLSWRMGGVGELALTV